MKCIKIGGIMNKLLVSLITASMLFSISGCKSKDVASVDNSKETEQIKEKTDNLEKADEPVIIQSTSELEMPVNIYDPQYLIETEDYISIVKVKNIHGENYNEINEEYVSPFTVGDIDVIYSIKGEPRESSKFTRMGARIAFDKYLEGLPEIERSKIENNNLAETRPDYVDYTFANSPLLEEGQYYLVFMKDSNYVIKDEHYSICWYPAGTLKIKNLDEGDYLNSTIVFGEKEMTIKEYLGY